MPASRYRWRIAWAQLDHGKTRGAIASCRSAFLHRLLRPFRQEGEGAVSGRRAVEAELEWLHFRCQVISPIVLELSTVAPILELHLFYATKTERVVLIMLRLEHCPTIHASALQ